MKLQNKITSMLGFAALGIVALSSCEGSELYSVNAPDWLASRIDSIAEEKKKDVPEELDLKEDVYTIGKTDFTSGWWADFSKYYQIPENEKLQVQFNLNINPAATNTYKNFAMILTNDVDRGGAGYAEYGAIRFDNQPSGNSEWGDYIDRDKVESTLTFATDTDPGVDKLGGKVTVTVDRSQSGKFYVEMNNGTVVKKYNSAALPNINPEDINSNNIRVFFVVEGSYINFIGTNIDPIGGCTSKEDKQPLSMTLKGVPGKVMINTPLDSIVANVTAVVEFETGVSKEVSAADLTFLSVPDLTSLGQKTIVAAYSKTYKGEGAAKAVMASASFQLVDKMYYTLGETSCTTGWWGAHSTKIKVEPGETQVSSFTNYTNGGGNWNNWVMVLTGEADNEYAVVRADNYGWRGADNSAANNDVLGWTLSGGQADWAAWLAAMNGAKCTAFVTNVGDGTAEVKVIMNGTDGEEYIQEYGNIKIDDINDFYYHFTVDGSCLVFDDVLGEENNSTGWWGAHSQKIKVEAGQKVSQTFINYAGGSNWNNFVVVLTGEADNEYAVVRADNYGWRGADNSAANNDVLGWELSGGQADWAAWLAAMDGAKVTVTVENVGDGTTNISALMIGNDGEEYIQYYNHISVDDVDDVYFHFTVDGCHLVFDNN